MDEVCHDADKALSAEAKEKGLSASTAIFSTTYIGAGISLFYVHKYILWLIRIEVDSTKHWESPTKKAEEDLPAYWYKKYAHCTANR